MTRMFLSLLAFFSFINASSVADAQIKVVKKPAPAVKADQEVVYETWISSWGLRDDGPNEYPFGTATHRTESEAVAAAKAQIARTAGNGNLSVTHFLIEGEPSVHNKVADRILQAQDLLERLKQAKEVYDRAKDGLESTFKAAERRLGGESKITQTTCRSLTNRLRMRRAL